MMQVSMLLCHHVRKRKKNVEKQQFEIKFLTSAPFKTNCADVSITHVTVLFIYCLYIYLHSIMLY